MWHSCFHNTSTSHLVYHFNFTELRVKGRFVLSTLLDYQIFKVKWPILIIHFKTFTKKQLFKFLSNLRSIPVCQTCFVAEYYQIQATNRDFSWTTASAHKTKNFWWMDETNVAANVWKKWVILISFKIFFSLSLYMNLYAFLMCVFWPGVSPYVSTFYYDFKKLLITLNISN